MKAVLLVIIAAAFITQPCSSALISGTLQQKHFDYKKRIQILHDTLAVSCPSYAKVKRDLTDANLEATIIIQRIHYNKLLNLLRSCLKSNTQQG